MASLQVQKLSDKAILPTKGSTYSAGWDLYNIEDDYILQPFETKAFKTDIAIALPPNTYGRVAPRSGLALKKSIMVNGGVIDEDYRADINVILVNIGQDRQKIAYKDRIAQLIIEKIENCQIQQVNELNETERGQNGFGSSGH